MKCSPAAPCRTLIALAVLLVVPLVSLSANPPRSWNYRDNPAYLGVRSRPFVEIAASQSLGVSNSYFSAQNVLQPTFVLDLSALGDHLGGRDLKFAGTTNTGGHMAISVLDLTISLHSSVDSLISFGIPGSLFTVLAEGNRIGKRYSGSTPVIGRVFAEAGGQVSYRYRHWEIGGSLGLFTPLLYTDPDAKVSFNLETDKDAGSLALSGGLRVPAYSSIDVNNPGETGQISLDGIKVDFGVVHVYPDDSPWFGANISGITLVPARARYQVLIENGVSVSVNNIVDQGDADAITTETTGTEPTVVEEGSNKRVSAPLHVGGFYRSTIIPGIALTGYSQFYITDPLLYGAGVTIEGDVFPIRGIAFSLGYDRVAWETEVGLRANLRVFELGLEVGLSSPQFVSMWEGSGFNANLFIAVGI